MNALIYIQRKNRSESFWNYHRKYIMPYIKKTALQFNLVPFTVIKKKTFSKFFISKQRLKIN